MKCNPNYIVRILTGLPGEPGGHAVVPHHAIVLDEET